MQKAEEKIWFARITVFGIAFLYICFAVIIGIKDESGNMLRAMGIGLAIAGIFIAFGVMAKEAPFTGLLGALIFYCLLVLLEVLIGEFGIFRGLILRLAFIGILLRALLVAKEYEQARKEQQHNT